MPLPGARHDPPLPVAYPPDESLTAPMWTPHAATPREVPVPVDVDDQPAAAVWALEARGCTVAMEPTARPGSRHHLCFRIDSSWSVTLPVFAAASGVTRGRLGQIRHLVRFEFLIEREEQLEVIAVLLNTLNTRGAH